MIPQSPGTLNVPPPAAACPTTCPQGNLDGALPASSWVPQPDPPACAPVTEPPIDEALDQAVGAIGEGCSVAGLDEHVRELCRVLVERHANNIITNGALDKLNRRLATLRRTKLTKVEWKARLKEA